MFNFAIYDDKNLKNKKNISAFYLGIRLKPLDQANVDFGPVTFKGHARFASPFFSRLEVNNAVIPTEASDSDPYGY